MSALKVLLPRAIEQYAPLNLSLKELWEKDPEAATEASRLLCRTDLYWLLRYVFGRADIERPWLFERCREVQDNPDGYLDLWSREHYKSTIITFAKTIQDILASHGNNPLPEWEGIEPTFGIFSHTRPTAKKFLAQIKRELEANEQLKSWFPDILWGDTRQSPKWSEDDGLIVKRKSNPKEATVEAWGLVDGQPTSKHFTVLIYDDVVTADSVTTPDQIEKVTNAWAVSLNLSMQGGRIRTIGTRWDFNDTYKTMIDRQAVKPRIYTATKNGEVDGEPVLWNPEYLETKRRNMGPYVTACQLFQDPKKDDTQGFKREWLKFFNTDNSWGMNKYLIVDPAGEKKKTSDKTAIAVIGLGSDKNYYLLDALWDRLNLKERTDGVFYMHRKWKPKGVGYEKYGKDSDIEHILHMQEELNYRFEVTPLGGRLGNRDRIRRLVPIFADNRFYLPKHLFRTLYDGKRIDLIEHFLTHEYDPFPTVHCDLLDIISRVLDEDLQAIWPKFDEDEERPQRYSKDSLEWRRRFTRMRSGYPSPWAH